MAPPPAIPSASKAKTLAHMNTDHAADLALYLRHFAHQPAALAAGATLTDMTLSSLTLALPSTGTTHVLPLAPPLASWDERRARLVAMSQAAHAALDPVAWRAPRGLDVLVLAGVAVYFACWAAVRLGGVEPGGVVWEGLERGQWPGGAVGFRWLVDTIFVPVLGIHVSECWWMDRTRLGPRGMRGTRGWWAWMGSCFLEGVPSFRRFDGVVEQRLREAEKKRH